MREQALGVAPNTGALCLQALPAPTSPSTLPYTYLSSDLGGHLGRRLVWLGCACRQFSRPQCMRLRACQLMPLAVLQSV